MQLEPLTPQSLARLLGPVVGPTARPRLAALSMGKTTDVALRYGFEHLGHFVDEALDALERGRVASELDFYPIEGIDFDPTRDNIVE